MLFTHSLTHFLEHTFAYWATSPIFSYFLPVNLFNKFNNFFYFLRLLLVTTNHNPCLCFTVSVSQSKWLSFYTISTIFKSFLWLSGICWKEISDPVMNCIFWVIAVKKIKLKLQECLLKFFFVNSMEINIKNRAFCFQNWTQTNYKRDVGIRKVVLEDTLVMLTYQRLRSRNGNGKKLKESQRSHCKIFFC
jgi:hypothetical protein